MTSFASDSLSEADALNRAPFARKLLSIVGSVDATNGAVVGLSGSWGSGKSWILDKARDIYQQESNEAVMGQGGPHIHWVSFSPWALSGSDTLIEAMLIEIAQQIRLDSPFDNFLDDRAKFAESVLGYVVALTKVRHALPLLSTSLSATHPAAAIVAGGVYTALDAVSTQGEKAKGFLAKLRAKWRDKLTTKEGNRQAGAIIREKSALQGASLHEARERVCSALKELGGRVVIVIDDLDRMAPKEIVEILQTVKAVADFPQVVYVLSYDPVITASALERTLQVQSGHAFLEKIVQVPLEVPDPSPVKLMQAALKMMAQARTALQIPPSKENESRAQLAAALMRRPRDLVRLRSRMELVLPHVVGAMDIDDVVLVLALQIRAPEVVNYLNENRAFFLDAGHLQGNAILKILGHVGDRNWGFDDFVQKSKQVRDELARMVKALGENERLVANSLNALNLVSPHGATSEDESKHLRVSNLGNWMRLRSLGKDNTFTDNDDLIALLAQPSLIRNSTLANSARTAYTLFVRLEPFLKPAMQGFASEVTIDVPALAETLSELVADFGEECRISGGSFWPAEIVHALFEKASLEDRIHIVRVSTGKQSLHDTGRLLLKMQSDLKQSPSAQSSASKDALSTIFDQWKSMVYKFIKDPKQSPLDDWRPGNLIDDLVALGEEPSSVAKSIEASIDLQPEQGLDRWLGSQPISPDYVRLWAAKQLPGWPNVHYFARLLHEHPHALANKTNIADAFRNAASAAPSSQAEG